MSFGNCNPLLMYQGVYRCTMIFLYLSMHYNLFLLLTVLMMMCKFHTNVTAVKRFVTLRIYVNSLDPVFSEYAFAR